MGSLLAILAVIFVGSYVFARVWDYYEEAGKRGAAGRRDSV